MTPRTVLYSALVAAFFAGDANAIGFGEIALHSRLGEGFRGEIPLYMAPGEIPKANCFTLVRGDAADLPALTKASLRLMQKNGGYILSIRSGTAVREPLFVVSIKANCGMELQRSYVLMPDPPTYPLVDGAIVDLPPDTAPPDPRRRLAREGETLADIAASLAPNSQRQQTRMLSGLRRANPDIASDEALEEGTEIMIPKAQPRPVAVPSSRVKMAGSPPARPAVQAGKTNRTASPVDRVILSATPPEPRPPERAAPPAVTLGDIEERMLKLETTLRSLHSEVEKLDQALVEANAALNERNRLQLAQQIETPSLRASLPTPPASGNKGLELLLSGLLGGTIAVLFARFLGRRQERLADREMPLMMNGYHQEVFVPHAPMPEPPDDEAELPPHRKFDPAAPEDNEFSRSHPLAPEIRVDDVEFNEADNEMELVELLLASGRERGAATVLARHIDNSSPNHIQPWKQLIELYRHCNMQTEFEALRLRIRDKFNVQIPDWQPPPPPIPPQ